MYNYIGRQDELDILNSRWNRDTFEFGVVYGRRRIGKTSLLHKFLEDKKTIFLQSTRDNHFNLRKLSSAIGRALFGSENIASYASFATAFSVIADKAQDERIALVLDEISYLADADKTILSVLQSFVDQDFKKTKLFLVLCGSNMSFIEKDLLGVNSPVYGRRTFQINLKPFSISETSAMLSSWSLEDVAIAHSVSGGIPYYLSLMKEYDDIRDAIKKEFFKISGALFVEGRLYLMMELRAIELYDGILSHIASGVNDVTRIAYKIGKDKAAVSQALSKLYDMGIVRRRKKIASRGVDRGWVFSDYYFYFFYRYVYPYSEMIELGIGEAAFGKAWEDLPIFMGYAMEGVFQRHILLKSGLLITEIGNIDFPNPETKQNEELDLVAVSNTGMLFGECNWTKELLGKNIYDNLVRRSLIAYPAVGRKTYFLLSKNGFTEELKALADNSDGSLILIEGKDLLS